MSTLVTKYIQLGTDSTVSNNYVISTPVSPDGSLRISNGVVGNATDVMKIGTDGTIYTCLPGSTGNTVYPSYSCRAWVNFNGTWTVAIRASGNVSSITDNGVGDYTVNFTTAMPDVNYAVVATCGSNSEAGGFGLVASNSGSTASTSKYQVRTTTNVSAVGDNAYVYVAFFR